MSPMWHMSHIPLGPKLPTCLEFEEICSLVHFWLRFFLEDKLEIFIKRLRTGGFPGGAVVGNLPANAGDTGSSPGLGRSHTPRSDWAREPQLLSLRVWSLCPATRGAAIVKGPRTAMKSGPHTKMKSGPRLPQLEKALARNGEPTQLKINK